MSSEPGHSQYGIRFWLTAAAGWAVIAYGIRGVFTHHLETRPTNLATFVVGGVLLHDLAWVPLLLVTGVTVARAVPGPVRAIVQAALIVSGTLVVFAYPLVRDYASILNNPSSLPHNYTANLAIILGTVWAIAGVATIVRLRQRPTEGGPGSNQSGAIRPRDPC